MDDIKEAISKYFQKLDTNYEKISHLHEGKITKLFPWVLCNRHIKIGITGDGEGVVMKVTPVESYSEDIIEVIVLQNDKILSSLLAPMQTTLRVSQIKTSPSLLFGDFSMLPENPLSPPVDTDKSMIFQGNIKDFSKLFSPSAADEEAISLWNSLTSDYAKSSGSYIQEVRNIFFRFSSIVKRKSFLERRVHRFINDHRQYLLPNFRNCHFEVPLHLNGEIRKADFILEREEGFPPLLVELESPVHKVFRKDGEYTKEVNHAKNQINEWVTFIDKNPKENCREGFSFLSGPKNRLVIIGRGLDNKQKMIDSKFSDTTIWTYDLFLQQARGRMNKDITSQCKLIGLDPITPF
jgi:hypothetical protein